MWKKNKESDPAGNSSPEHSLGMPRPQPENNKERHDSVDIEELLGIKDSGSSVSLLDLWYLIKERWLLGVLVGSVLAAFTAFMIMRQPEQFQSTIEFDMKGEELVLRRMFETRGDSELDAHVTKVMSQNFFNYMADGLAAKPELAAALGGDDKTAIVNNLSLAVSATRANNFIKVNVRHSSPEVAADVANEIGVVYKLFDEDSKAGELKDNEKTLGEELENARTALDEVNRKLFELGESSGIGGEVDLPAIELQQLKSQAAALEADILEQEQVLDAINAEPDILKKITKNPQIESSNVVQSSKQVYDKAVNDQALLSNSGVAERHPDLIAAKQTTSQARASLESAVRGATLALENKLNSDRKQLARVNSDLQGIEDLMGGRNKQSGEYGKLQTQKEQFIRRMTDYQKQLDDIRVKRDAGLSNIEALDRALPNPIPVTPDKRLALLASLAIFGLSLVGLPVTLGLLDSRLKTISEIEKFLGVDCLATVHAKKGSESEELGLAVMMANDEDVVESFRVLYSSLRMISHNDYPQTMLVTSSAPSEGKSFITTNLAAFFAEQGKRTLIVDCDFRKPTQHRNVKESNDQGLIRWYLSDEPVPQDPDQFGESKALGFLALGESENLFLLRAGGSSKSPTAMIESTRFAQLIHALRSYFDVILFDTPPVGLFPDALFVADYTDEAIFVNKFRELNRHKVKFALTQLQKAGCNVLGVVVNYLTTRASTGYGYGYSDYGYGHYSSKDYARYYSTNDKS